MYSSAEVYFGVGRSQMKKLDILIPETGKEQQQQKKVKVNNVF